MIAMFVVGNGFNSPITPQAGVAISFVCLVASIFGFLVAKSKKMRDKLLEPKRSHNYREQDFYLLGFVGLALAIGMYYIPSFGHAQSF